MADEYRCDSTFTFAGMQTYFECQNRRDVPYQGKPNTWSHRHGRWHYFEDEDAEGRTFRVEWEDAPDADDQRSVTVVAAGG